MGLSNYQNVRIERIATLDADERLTSSELEEMLAPACTRLQLPARLIESLTGIRARRLWRRGAH